jgi:hypothetical protein
VNRQVLRGARDLTPQIAMRHEIAVWRGKVVSDLDQHLIEHRLRVNADWTVERLREDQFAVNALGKASTETRRILP